MVVDTRVITPDTDLSNWAGFSIVRSSRIVQSKALFMCLYGPGGSGKSTLAASIGYSKNAGKVLHVDMEGQGHVLAHLDFVHRMVMTSFSGANKTLQQALRGNCPFGTIIYDNLSELQNLSIRAIAGDEQATQPQWGKSTAELLKFVRECRDLTEKQGINVILTAWNENEKDEATGRVRNHVGFTPSFARQFPGMVPLVGLVKPTEQKPPYRRTVTFIAGEQTDCKYGVAPIGTAKDIPLQFMYGIDDPVLADFLDAMRGEKKWPTEKYAVKSAS